MMDTNAVLEDLKTLVNKVRERIQRIAASERDRKAVGYASLGAAVLILYLIFQFFSSGTGRLEKKAQALQIELKKLDSLRNEYIQSKGRIEELSKSIKTGDESLISVVEKILVESRVDRGNFSIKSRTSTSGDLYDETSVDVDLKKIPLDRMVDVLYKIQTTTAFLKVSKLRPQTRFDNPDLMDVSFRVSTFKLNKVL